MLGWKFVECYPYTVTARDTVNFTGTAVVGIEAAPKDKLLNKAAVTISPKSYTYTGGEIVPEEKAYTVCDVKWIVMKAFR